MNHHQMFIKYIIFSEFKYIYYKIDKMNVVIGWYSVFSISNSLNGNYHKNIFVLW